MLSRSERLIAAAEVLLGAVAVIAHNVFRVLPNEVPILVLIFWGSVFIRRQVYGSWPWLATGLGTPVSWKRTAWAAVCAGVLLQLKDLVTEPFARLIWNQPEVAPSVIAKLHSHSPAMAVQAMAIVWTFAAFGEEAGYRGVLLRRTADALNGSRAAYAAALVFSSILFGLGHFFKGPTGVFDSTISGLILGAAYLGTRRNLWASILAHGLSDSVAVAATYFYFGG